MTDVIEEKKLRRYCSCAARVQSKKETFMTTGKKVSADGNKQTLRVLAGEALIGGALALFLASFAFAADTLPQPGQKIFLAKCAQCHGKDGKGLPNMAKVLKVDPAMINLTQNAAVTMTDDQIATTVTNGNKKMPKFKGKLTADQIQDTIKYLRTLQSAAGVK
jgi:mono/diheme cytochrome c family protein